MLCIPNGSAVFRKPTRDRSVRMVESYSPGNCNLQPQVVRRVHWCSAHVHGWSKDALHQAARLVYTLTIFTAREHRRCSQVVNVCLVQCTYMSTACIHGPYSPVLGTHYPCSRPVNAAIDPPVCAQLTVDSPYTLEWAALPHSKLPLPMDGSRPPV